MSTKTVVVISDQGRMVDVTGADKESESHYKKFADRLLGDNGTQAVLNYGWNGKNKLIITGASSTGAQIVLDAAEVVVPSTFKVGNTTLGELLKISETTALNGIRGTNGQISVEIVENPASGTDGQPDNLCVLSLNSTYLNRLDILEAQVSGMLRFDDIYYAGDGIKVDHVNKRIGVRLGTGLTFEEVISNTGGSSDSSTAEDDSIVKAITVDIAGIIEAVTPKYTIQIDQTTHNAALYENTSV